MSILYTLEQWLGELVVPLVFIGFAMLMGFVLLYFSAQSRRAALVRDRSGWTEDTFAEYLAAYGFNTGIARMTYRYLQNVRGVEFPILPKDDLDRDLGLDDQDLKQTIRDLLGEAGREYLPGRMESPLVTVVDLVRYIQASPQRVATLRRKIA